jgi:hypothetical protein
VIDPQWKFVADMNLDGAVTISDVIAWLGWLFCYPGDTVIFFLMARLPSLAQFFEIDYTSYHGWLSAFISLVVWMGVFLWCVLMPLIYIADYKYKKAEAERKKTEGK